MAKIPVASVRHGTQLRVQSKDSNESLEASLTKHGQLCEILVREHPSEIGKFEVIFGNRRLEAARKLGWETIEAKIVNATEQSAMILALCENLDRKDLCDYEKAVIFERIHLSTGKSYAEVASLIGRSPAFVSLHVAMLNLFPESIAPEEKRMKVLCALTERHARVLSGIQDDYDRWNTAKLAFSANLSVRELEKLCGHAREKRDEPSRNRDVEYIRDLVEGIVLGFDSKDMRPHSKVISSDHFTLFSSFPPFGKMDGTTAVEHFCALMNRVKERNTEIKDLDIRLCGDFAYVTFIEAHELLIRERSVKNELRATIILEKKNEWKIVHEHWSSANPMEHLAAYIPDRRVARLLVKA